MEKYFGIVGHTFLMCVYRPDMSLQVLAAVETLSTTFNGAHIKPAVFLFRIDGASLFRGYSSAATLLC